MRRLLFGRDQVEAALRRLGLARLVAARPAPAPHSPAAISQPAAPIEPAAPPKITRKPAATAEQAPPTSNLERLRAAQERARRRARGEE